MRKKAAFLTVFVPFHGATVYIPKVDSGCCWRHLGSQSQLAPLSGHLDTLSVLSGFEVKAPNNDAHTSGPCGLLSGRALLNSGGSFTFTGPSVDQMVAATLGGDTQFRSIELGVEENVSGLSFNGTDSRNPPESDPAALFARLFGQNFREPGAAPILDPKLALRRSVLDAVMENAGQLRGRLGRNDQLRLDQHLNAVRELELRIARLEESPPNLAACSRPPMVRKPPDIDGRPQMAERAAIMNELSAMAFACDLTRVLSYWYSDPLSDTLYFDAAAGHHQLTHDEPGDMPTVDRITTAIMLTSPTSSISSKLCQRAMARCSTTWSFSPQPMFPTRAHIKSTNIQFWSPEVPMDD